MIVYEPQEDSYDTLPPYTCYYFSMAVVDSQLVLVGGRDVETRQASNKLGVWNEQSKSWTYTLPSMTSACSSASVATLKNRWLFVIGGLGDGTALSRVEILDATGSRQWYNVTPLPKPCYSMSATTIGNMCYLLGGYSTSLISSKDVLCVDLDHLITRVLAVSQPAACANAQCSSSPWQTLPSTPMNYSTALAINGALLAVGAYGGSTTIYHYRPSSGCWVEAGELPAGRSCCVCAVLPNSEIFVAGGYNTAVDIAILE